MKKYALFSVNELEDIVHFARVLTSHGWSIVATERPCELLKKAGFDVISVAELVNITEKYTFPPTLHPKIEYLLTDNTAQERIELVYNITYELDTGNDVGGHTLLALAAKGSRLPISSYKDMREVVSLIEKNGNVPEPKRKELIAKANFKVVAHYSRLLASSDQQYDMINMQKEQTLINGENPYQVPSDLMSVNSKDPLAIHHFDLITDNVPCFTNMADVDCILATLCKLSLAFNTNRGKAPFITVAAKHGNACGIGIDWNDPAESIRKALWGNPLAIWGGEIVVNFPLSIDTATLLYSSKERAKKYGNDKWMLDVVLAPEIDNEAQKVFVQRKNTKVFANKHLAVPSLPVARWVYRYVRGGALRQPPASYILNLKDVKWVGGKMSEGEIDSLIVAWGCSFSANHGGNEVAIASNGSLLGVGGGPSTVDAVEIAIQRSLKNSKGLLSEAIFAADAFFPFTDAPEMLAEAGCIGGCVPSGGVKEKEVIDFFEERNLKVAFLNEKYRGFCRH